jgi:biotin transporter BioY
MLQRPEVAAMPDRLPSLIVLVGFWIPPAVAGWVAAGFLRRHVKRPRPRSTAAALTAFVCCYVGAWFYYNYRFMPPYIPGAVMDPTVATPQAVAALAVFTTALILPGSAIACVLAFQRRHRRLLP